MGEPISDGELDQLRQRVGGAHLSGGCVEGISARIDAADAERDQAVERAARFQQIISDNHHLDFDQMTRALRNAEERAALAYADAQKAEDENKEQLESFNRIRRRDVEEWETTCVALTAAEAEVARLEAGMGIARRMTISLRADGCTCRRITYDEAYHELHQYGC